MHDLRLVHFGSYPSRIETLRCSIRREIGGNIRARILLRLWSMEGAPYGLCAENLERKYEIIDKLRAGGGHYESTWSFSVSKRTKSQLHFQNKYTSTSAITKHFDSPEWSGPLWALWKSQIPPSLRNSSCQ